MMKTRRFLPAAVPQTILLLMIACHAHGSVSPTVVINEVYYDHPGSDTGHEFIELYCHGEAGTELEGWSIALIDGRTGSMRELWTAGPGRTIDGGGLLLIGGDSCLVTVDCLLKGSIENGPDHVVLLRAGEEIDLVGYGGDGPGCSPGRSLSRCPDGKDSDDTGSDFVCAPPTPGSMNFHETDLSVSFKGRPHVICESQDTDITVVLENRGLNRYSGMVSVTVSTVMGELRETAGGRRAVYALDPGAEQPVVIPCTGIPGGSSTLEVRALAEGDTNMSNDIASGVISSSPGDIVINEIMYRPVEGGEWIELFNRSPASVDLSRWSVIDMSGASGSIDERVEIAAGGFLILAQDPVSFSAEFPSCGAEVTSLENGWPRLNDGGADGTAEEIFILRGDGSLEESISYPGPVFDEKGRSIERLSPGLCSSGTGGIWLRCGASAGATPGERNYCHTGSIPAAGMHVSPDPFCPGVDGSVSFSAAAAAGETSYSASLFDMKGREISRLASGPTGAPAVSFNWDGCHENGRPVVTGLYICVVEFKCGGGGVCRREKCAVRVWAGHR